jgi:hypothetical protein
VIQESASAPVQPGSVRARPVLTHTEAASQLRSRSGGCAGVDPRNVRSSRLATMRLHEATEGLENSPDDSPPLARQRPAVSPVRHIAQRGCSPRMPGEPMRCSRITPGVCQARRCEPAAGSTEAQAPFAGPPCRQSCTSITATWR